MQVDRINGLIGSVAVKPPCLVATTANITLSGEQTIDGVAVTAGDRVLVKDQTTGTENGIYEVATTAWARTPDWNGERDIVQGTCVRVISGTAGAGFFFEVANQNPVVGTTSLTFNVVNFPTTTSAFIATLLDDLTAGDAQATLQLVIGADVQGYDPDTTKNDQSNTFTLPQVFNGANPIVLEGATDDDFKITISVTDPTADRTQTIPDKDGTFAMLDDVSNGKILSAAMTTDTTNRTTTSTSWVDSGVSITGTLSNAANKFRIRVNGICGNNGLGKATHFTLFRDLTDITPAGVSAMQSKRSEQAYDAPSVNFELEDSPGDTATHTYKLYWKVNSNTGYLGRNSSGSFDCPTTMVLEEIEA